MAEMFANAIGYEHVMGRWSARLAPGFAEFAQVPDCGRLLDVGCGTGTLTEWIESIAPQMDIVGIDPAQSFIDYARSRFTSSRISFRLGNVLDLPFSNDSFDLCLSLLVLMFVPDSEKAVSEMCRVTRPGGIVGACTWAHDGLDLSQVFWEEASKLDREGVARAERALHSNRQGQLSALWKNAGLTEVEEATIEIQTTFLSFGDYWSPLMTGVGPNGVYLASLSADRRDALRSALRKRLLPTDSDGPILLRARALAVRGVVAR